MAVKSFRQNGEEPTICTICKQKTLITNHRKDMILCENPECPEYLNFREVGEGIQVSRELDAAIAKALGYEVKRVDEHGNAVNWYYNPELF